MFARELHLLCGQTSHSFVADLRKMYLPDGGRVNFRRHRRLQPKIFPQASHIPRTFLLFFGASLKVMSTSRSLATRYLYYQVLLSSLTLKVCAFVQNVFSCDRFLTSVAEKMLSFVD